MKQLSENKKVKKINSPKVAYCICSGAYSSIHYWDDSQQMTYGNSETWLKKYKNLSRMNRSILLDKKYVEKLSCIISLKNGSKLEVKIPSRESKKMKEILKLL